MGMARGKYFSHYPTFQQNNFKRTSIQIFALTHTQDALKIERKGEEKSECSVDIFTNLNWIYIGKNVLCIPVSHGSCVLWTSFEMVKR